MFKAIHFKSSDSRSVTALLPVQQVSITIGATRIVFSSVRIRRFHVVSVYGLVGQVMLSGSLLSCGTDLNLLLYSFIAVDNVLSLRAR